VPGAPFPQPYVSGHLYEIRISNLDEPSKLISEPARLVDNHVRGDLHFYYGIMEVSGPKHYLYARRVPRVIDGDCHPVGTGQNGGSVSELDRLLEP
jgi:hypothetical protein